MFNKQFVLVLAIFSFAFIALSNPAVALSPADKNWTDLQKRGTAALDANQYGIAETLLKKATLQAQDFRPTDMRLPKSIAELGRLYTVRGQFSKAAAYLEAELKVREQLLRKEQYQCIPTMGSLVQFYFTYDMQNKAAPLTKKMLTLLDNSFKTIPLAPVLEWGIICDNLGDRFHSSHNFELADRLFKTSVRIKTMLLSSDHLSLAYTYERIGTLRMEQNDPSGAEPYFTNALKITEKNLPPENHDVYTRLDKLAKCLAAQKKYEAAEALYLRAQYSYQAHAQPEELTSTLFALGSLYTDEHKYKAALSSYQRALELAKQTNGANSAALRPYIDKIELVKSAQHPTPVKQTQTPIETEQEFVLSTPNSMLSAEKKSEQSASHQPY